jgi:hypothetical protein
VHALQADELGSWSASASDVLRITFERLAGAAAGCRTILVRTGWGEHALGAYRHTWANVEPDYVADDVLAASRFICSDTREWPPVVSPLRARRTRGGRMIGGGCG